MGSGLPQKESAKKNSDDDDSHRDRNASLRASLIPRNESLLLYLSSLCYSETRPIELKRYRNSEPQLRFQFAVVVQQALAVAAEVLKRQPAREVTAAEFRQRIGQI